MPLIYALELGQAVGPDWHSYHVPVSVMRSRYLHPDDAPQDERMAPAGLQVPCRGLFLITVIRYQDPFGLSPVPAIRRRPVPLRGLCGRRRDADTAARRHDSLPTHSGARIRRSASLAAGIDQILSVRGR